MEPKKQKPFSRLNKSEKRVAIAKDVIAQIEAGVYEAREGDYVSWIDGDYEDESDIKENFSKIKRCGVCALGACLISITKYKNSLNFSDALRFFPREQYDTDGKRGLRKVKKLFSSLFSGKQLLLIENAFEGIEHGSARVGEKLFSKKLTVTEKNRCRFFYKKYLNNNDRLIAIMINIIKNKGIFKPSQN